ARRLPARRAGRGGCGARRERLPLPADDHCRGEGRHGGCRDHRAVTAPLSVASRRVPARLPALQRLAVAALVALLVLAMAAGWLLWDNRRLDVSHYEVGLAQLPAAADGLRIAQVSDLHAASFGTFPQRLLAGVEAAQPDLIAITGDL